MKAKEFIPPSKPRNPVVRNQQTSGAGAHRDKKKEQKQGYEKHKGKGVAEVSLGTVLKWPEVINKISSAMKATGWKVQRKDEDLYMFTTKGQLDDEWYVVTVENEGDDMFTYALGTVEEGDPHIGEKDTLPNTEASVSELINSIRDGYGLNEQGVVNTSVQDKLYQRHQTLRKKTGLPDPKYYKELSASYDIKDDKERIAKQTEIKKKYSVGEDTNIPFNQCPNCRGPIFHESLINEKQDACYHKVRSRYKVWPSAYASGALVQCRKKGAKNWGNKSK